MAVTSLTATPIGGGAYRLDWASDLPAPVTFYVYRDGVQLLTTNARSLVVAPTSAESPVFDVLDDPAALPAPAFPAYALLAFYATPGAASYLVEQFVAGAWVEQTTIDDNGDGYFTWRSRPLADGQTHQFRVTPIGVNGNAGTPRSFVLLMVHTPDAPKVSYSYNAGTGQVTISAL